MPVSPADGVFDEVDDLMLAGYRQVVESGEWSDDLLSRTTGASVERVAEARRTLARLRVIERDVLRSDRWRAVSPRVAMSRVVAPVEREAQRKAARAETLRERFQSLLPLHTADPGAGDGELIELLRDDDEVAAVLDQETARCGSELLVMQGEAEPTVRARRRWLDAGRRGVTVRAVFRHSGRFHPPTEGFMDTVGSASTQFRTAVSLPTDLVVFDRSTCVLSPPGPDGGDGSRPAAGHTVIRHRLIASVLAGMFDEVWATATPYSREQPQPAGITDEIRTAVLRLLAGGAKDDTVARRLGISISTCRRHIAHIMSGLGAHSRFQAGVEAQKRGLLDARPTESRRAAASGDALLDRPAC